MNGLSIIGVSIIQIYPIIALNSDYVAYITLINYSGIYVGI